jgi:hypothetical protein
MGQNAKYSLRVDIFRFTPQDRTWLDAAVMSVSCQKRTSSIFAARYMNESLCPTGAVEDVKFY